MRRCGTSFISSSTLLILCLGLVAVGCGYRPLLAGGASPTASADSPPGSPQRERLPTRLAVMAIRNDSPEPWLDRVLTDAMRREMGARGSLALVNDPKNADLILRGRVRPLFIQSRSFSSFVAALEYSITIGLDLEVVRRSGDVVALDTNMLTETEIYLASADIETTRTHKIEALRRLADLLASRIADSIELMEQPIGTPRTAPVVIPKKAPESAAGKRPIESERDVAGEGV